MINWLASNVTGLSVIGAVMAFFWPILQFVITRRRDLQFREFETYHRLVKELLDGDRIDHQAAVIFELRYFPRYYEYSARMLARLRVDLLHQVKAERLIEEIDETLTFIGRKIPNTALKPRAHGT
jgi:hypothetical protein